MRTRSAPPPFVQPSLFVSTEKNANRTRTSRAAAKSSTARAPSCRELILRAIAIHPHQGLTHEEIALETGIRLDTVKARVHELGELGSVSALKETRATSSGTQALVFVLAEHVWTRELEPWPIRRIDWKARAMAAERRVIELEQLTSKGA